MKLYQKEDIQKIDKQAFADHSLEEIIEEVGQCLGQWFLDNTTNDQSVLILSGPGNNGNDGKALEKFLKQKNYSVEVVEPLQQKDIDTVPFDIVVDALFGISICRDLQEPIIKLFKEVESKNTIAIDLPSGLDPNTGKVWGGIFPAKTTLTIGGAKPGLYLMPGLESVGEIVVIGVPILQKYFDQFENQGELIKFKQNWMKQITPQRSDHKYSRGKVSFIMGKEMPGACLLAAHAAQASGAGYIQVYVPEEILKSQQLSHLSFVFTAYKEESDLIEQLKLDKKSSSFCLGPGWTGKSDSFAEFILKSQASFVLDGGLLKKSLLSKVSQKENIVITPHSGELAKLVEAPTHWQKVESFAQNFRGVVLAKAYDTLIYQKKDVFQINPDSSPFLAIAGTGDVLAGIVASFLAQGLSPMEASSFAVYMHTKLGKDINWGLTPEKMIDGLGVELKELSKYSN